MLPKILTFCKIVCLLSLSLLLFTIAKEVTRFNDHLIVETTQWRTTTQNEIHATRQELLSKVDDIRGDLRSAVSTTDRRISSIEGKVFAEVAAVRSDTFTKLDSIHNDLLPVRDSALVLAKTYNELPATVGARLDPYTDCKNNALCWQAQFSDTLFAVRTTTRAVGENVDDIATNVNYMSTNFATSSGIFARDFPIMTSNIAATTKNINKITQPKWYDRIITYAATGSLLYFNIVGGKSLAKVN